MSRPKLKNAKLNELSRRAAKKSRMRSEFAVHKRVRLLERNMVELYRDTISVKGWERWSSYLWDDWQSERNILYWVLGHKPPDIYKQVKRES